MKKVIVVVGPTASGKSSLAVYLAKAIHGEVINGDSVQVYRGLDIGSAKITNEEMNGVKHHLLDIKDIGEDYTVYHFQRDARALIHEIDMPIIAGGTGLYIKAALYDYKFDDPKRSEAFELQYKHHTKEEIAELVKEMDPEMDVKEYNRRRLLRALFMAKEGNKRSTKAGKDTPLYDLLILYLDIDRDILEKRLTTRLTSMLQQGFLDEAKTLFDKNVHVNAIGYREMDAYLHGDNTFEETKTLIIRNSRRLAKKQKTWFKHQMKAIFLDALAIDLKEQALAYCKAFIKGE